MQIKIGAYCITHEISRTPLSSTYLAYFEDKPKLRVVLKIFHHVLDHPEEHEKVFTLAERIKELSNPYILPVIDIGIVNEQLYVVTTFFPYGSLRYLQEGLQGVRLTLSQSLHIVIQVGRALSYAHQAEVLHKHLKPENILFGSNGQAYLSDFSFVEDQLVLSEENGLNFITLFYMAPESFFGTYDERSDLYSLGCIAYELITGAPPFIEQSFSLMALAHHAVQPTPLRSVVPDLPEDVEQVVMKALEKDPEQRYPDVATFLHQISCCLHRQLKRSSLSVTDTPFQEINLVEPDAQSPTVLNEHSAGVSPLPEHTEVSVPVSAKEKVVAPGVQESVLAHLDLLPLTSDKDNIVLPVPHEVVTVAENAQPVVSDEPMLDQKQSDLSLMQVDNTTLSEVPLMLPVLDFVFSLDGKKASDVDRFQHLDASYQPDDVDMQEKLNDGALQNSHLPAETTIRSSSLFGRASHSATRQPKPASQRRRLRKTTTLILFCLIVGIILIALSSYHVAGFAQGPALKSGNTAVAYGSVPAVNGASVVATSVHATATVKASHSSKPGSSGHAVPVPTATVAASLPTVPVLPTPVATPDPAVPTVAPTATATGGGQTPVTPTPVESSESYEAESSLNTASGGAIVAACSTCSGGRGIYFYGFTSYTLRFNNVVAEQSGEYTVTLYYSMPYTEAYTVRVTADSSTGSSTMQLVRTNDWNTLGTNTVTIALQAGNNTITFSGISTYYSPLFDRIVVSPS